MTPEERSLLIEFINRLRGFLRQLLVSRGGVPPPLARGFEAALTEVENLGAFDNLIRAIESRDFDDRLVDHGLVGAQLRLKIVLFNIAMEKYEKVSRSRFRWLMRRRREAEAGRRALEIADQILGSIAAATPVPGSGAAEELKQAFEWALGLWRDWRRRRSWPAEGVDSEPESAEIATQ